MDSQTIAEKFKEMPFAMLNWHRNWCEKQKQPFCLRHVFGLSQKVPWSECPNRHICFIAFINSNVELNKQ